MLAQSRQVGHTLNAGPAMAETSLRAYVREIDDLIEHEQLDEAIAPARHILQTYPPPRMPSAPTSGWRSSARTKATSTPPSGTWSAPSRRIRPTPPSRANCGA